MGNTHALFCFFRAALPLGVVLSTNSAISGNKHKTDNKENGDNKNNDNDDNNVLTKKKNALAAHNMQTTRTTHYAQATKKNGRNNNGLFKVPEGRSVSPPPEKPSR